MSEATPRSNPLVTIAAGSVIVFSLVGIGVMTGLIPTSSSRTVETTAAAPAPVAEAPKSEAPAPAARVDAKPEAPAAPAKPAAARAPAPKPAAAKQEPAQVAAVESRSTTPEPAPSAAGSAGVPPGEISGEPPRVAQQPRICTSCGTISTVTPVEQKGEGSGLGAVAGGVVGGLLGHQVGSGRGNTVATIAGAVGGAMAGNEVEKRTKSTRHYKVTVYMDDGSTRTMTFQQEPAFRPGDKVRVTENGLVAR